MPVPLNDSGLPLDPATMQALQNQQLMQQVNATGGGARERMNEMSVARAANTLFPDQQMRESQAAQQALAPTMGMTQNDGESDLDFSIRQMRAQRDALAQVSPESAAAINTKLLLAGNAKFEQDRLKAADQRQQDKDTRDQTKADITDEIAATRHVIGRDGKMLGSYNLMDTTQRAAYQAALQQNPGAFGASDSDMAKIQMERERGQTELLAKTRAAQGALGDFSDPKVEGLLASMASKGINLPTGFRSKAQMLATFQGLLKKYDGLSSDDIADIVGSGIIDFRAVGKATQTAAGILGRVNVASGELQVMAPIARDASAGVPRTDFVPFNKLQAMVNAGTSSPEQKRLYVATQAVLNAYDVLAARGGTDAKKRELQHKMLEQADGPQAYNAALDQIQTEVTAAHAGALSAIRSGTYGAGEQANLHAQETGQQPPTAAPGAAPTLPQVTVTAPKNDPLGIR